MRIVVTGRDGQVARCLIERQRAHGHEVVPLGRPQLDLAGPADAMRAALAASAPELIVSAAAYTAVDRAESEEELAYAVNARGAGAVAAAARELGVPLIHLSTDYVFDGSKTAPYVEDDPTCPQTVYGASKLAGEEAVLANHKDAVILRTAWVYSPFGANFVKTMLRLADTRDEIGVVADQQGNPTSALDIADGILAIASALKRSPGPDLRGIFHMTGTGEASWADFAELVFAESRRHGGPSADVRRIATSDFPAPAKRPANSRLDCSRLAHAYGVSLPSWQDSVAQVVARLVKSNSSEKVGAQGQ